MPKQANYEQALDKSGVQWEYLEQVPLEQINVNRGKVMQARLEPLDHDLIERYMEMLKDGRIPPPLLLWRQGRGMWIPLDGNQRLAANALCPVKYRLKTFDAYILKTDDPMIADRTCWSWNNLVNGKRMSYEECMNHAVTMCRKYNANKETAAKEWGIKAWQLWKIIAEQEMRELAQANNVHLPPALATDCIVDLSVLRKIGDDVALKALKTAAENGLGTNQVTELLKEVKKAPTSKEKIEAITEYAKQEKVLRTRAETQGGRVHLPTKHLPRVKLQKLLDELDELLKADKRALQPVGKDDKEEYIATSRRILNRLIDVYGLGAFLKEGAA